MKHLLIILFLVTCFSFGANCEARMWFMHIPPSSINSAMGYGYVGVADVWHQNPLIAFDNPAMPAMHEGVAYGYVRDKFLEGSPISHWYLNSGMLTVGYKGIGVLLPAINPYGNFGTFFDYGKMTVVSEEPFGPLTSYRAYESTRSYGISFNPLKYMRETDANYADKYAWLDVSAGLTYSRAYTNYLACLEPNDSWEGKEDILELGLLAKARKQVAGKLVVESSLGFRKYNLTNAVVELTDTTGTTPFGQNNIYGLGMAVSLPLSAVLEDKTLDDWVEHLFTLRVLADKNYSHDFGGSDSRGMEFGLLDAMFLRWGYNHDNADHWTGDTRGFGLNIHQKDMWALEYNYAEFPNANWPGDQHSWDVMLKIDPSWLYSKYKSNH